MNSPTHSLLALALLAKEGHTKRNWAIFIGSVIPDVAIYIWAPYQKFVNGVSGAEMWGKLYFEPPMQNLIASFNSGPIYMVLTMIGYAARSKLWGMFMMFFGVAALIHMATDLPVHGHDAYKHFWPLSEWRFYSPISYYEADLHGAWVSLVEMLIAFVSIFILWKRFPKLWVKTVLGILAFLYITMQVVFRLAAINIAS